MSETAGGQGGDEARIERAKANRAARHAAHDLASSETPAPLTWAQRGTRTANRLRVKVGGALLKDPSNDSEPVVEATRFLARVADGREEASVETRTTAAGALLRAGVAFASGAETAPTIDARSVTVNMTNVPDEDALAKVAGILADARAAQRERALRAAPPVGPTGTNGKANGAAGHH